MNANPFLSARQSPNSWVIPVSLMCVLLGSMAAMAWVTDQNRPSRRGLLGDDQRTRVLTGPIDLQEEYQNLNGEVAKLRAENTKLQNAIANQTGSTKALNDSLQEAKTVAGLTELEGPGVVVTLRDIDRVRPDALAQDQGIHDIDVLKVVNELFNAGAEAIEVNGHRVVGTTNFRCVGSTILVDGVKIATPIYIRAIGDADTLVGGLNLPLGVLDEIRSIDPGMVSIEKVSKMRLPAFNGSTTRRFAKVPQAPK